MSVDNVAANIGKITGNTDTGSYDTDTNKKRAANAGEEVGKLLNGSGSLGDNKIDLDAALAYDKPPKKPKNPKKPKKPEKPKKPIKTKNPLTKESSKKEVLMLMRMFGLPPQAIAQIAQALGIDISEFQSLFNNVSQTLSRIQ